MTTAKIANQPGPKRSSPNLKENYLKVCFIFQNLRNRREMSAIIQRIGVYI
jgi:hypothetical protein